tara:strand:- start:2979 stop:4913 length:1935 start_codon:yes stop_codon:yes gene_type:complete
MILKNGVSFIVTIYNKEKFISNTLQSIIPQVKKNCQLIIVDDGSSDSSLKITKKILKSHKKLDSILIIQKNTGPSIAINNALEKVKYSHIKLVDGDDIIAPDSADYMIKEMQDLDLDLLYGDWIWKKNPSSYSFAQKYFKATYLKNAFNKIFLSGWGGSSNLMIKTEVLQKINGCDPKIFIQDYSMPLRVSGYHYKSQGLKPHRIGISKKIICVGPEFIEDRIITNQGQTLHDLSHAAINFIEEHSNIEKKLVKNCLKKIYRRCLKWQRKKNKETILSLNYMRFLFSYIYFNKNTKKVRYEVFKTWKDDENIRKVDLESLWNVKKIFIYVGLDLLGDALIKLPFIRNLKSIFPKSEITWFAGKGKSEFKKKLNPLVVSLIDKIKDNANYGSKVLELFSKPKITEKYDIVFDTQKRLLTTLILKKIKTDLFISSTSNFLFSSIRISFNKEKNLAKQLFSLSNIFNFSQQNKIPNLPVKTNQYKFAKKFYEKYLNKKKVAICPGASVSWKCWPIKNYIEVSNYLLKNNCLPVFFLGPKEINYYKYLQKELPNALFPLQQIKDLSPISTIIFAKFCNLGISNDTGCGHLLATADIPMISLFGPTNAQKFKPFTNSKNIVLNASKYDNDNKIEAIPLEDVIKEIKEFI